MTFNSIVSSRKLNNPLARLGTNMTTMSVSYQSLGNDRMVRITEDGYDLGVVLSLGNGIGLCESPLPFSGYRTLGPWSPSSPMAINWARFFITRVDL